MIILLEDNTVLCSDGANINSFHPEITSSIKSQAIAKTFEYRHDINYTRANNEHVEELRFADNVIYIHYHECDAINNPHGKARLTERHSYGAKTLNPIEDQVNFSDRVKLFASIVF